MYEFLKGLVTVTEDPLIVQAIEGESKEELTATIEQALLFRVMREGNSRTMTAPLGCMS